MFRNFIGWRDSSSEILENVEYPRTCYYLQINSDLEWLYLLKFDLSIKHICLIGIFDILCKKKKKTLKK